MENLRRRAEAEPELLRKEAALRAERTKLEAVQARTKVLEAELEQEQEHEQADQPNGS